MDPRLYPSGKTVLPTATTDTETTDTDKIAVYRGNQLRSISLANLFLSVPNNLTIQTLTATGTVAANTNVLFWMLS